MKQLSKFFVIILLVFGLCATGCSNGAGGNAALETNTIAQEYVDESDIEPFAPELPVSEQHEQKEQTEHPVPEQPKQIEQTEQLVSEQPEQTEQLVSEQPEQTEQTAPEQTELEPPAPEPPVPEQSEDFVFSTEPKIVEAEYTFTKVNETECKVRIANKDIATKAVIPSRAEIDGKKYTVTEIDENGFASSPNLIQVILPITAKKIGSNAFAGCAKLNRINLANVEEIGNSVFMRCPELSELIIPLSVKKIGVQILRRNNTRVKVRADSDGEEWDEDWNKNNSGSVEYGGKYYQPIELDEVYDFDEL